MTDIVADDSAISILHLEDSLLDHELVHSHFVRAGIAVRMQRVDSRQPFLEALEKERYDLILADYVLPGFDGISALDHASRMAPETPFIFVSGTLGEELAIDCLKKGATDYVVKTRLERLVPAVERAVQDSKERKHFRQLETELSRSRERLDMVVDSANIGLWYCDLPFDRLIWNVQCKKHFGMLPEAEVTIDSFYAHIHPDDRERTKETIDRSISHDMPYNIEYRTVGLDGTVRWINAIGRTTFDQNSNPIRFDGVTLDITEQKRSEEALKEADRRKDDFLANMSHEIRTPMNAVIGIANILEIVDPLTPKQKNFVATLKSSAHHLMELLNDLLDMTRLENDRAELERVPLDPARLMREVHSMMMVKAREKDITLELEEEAGLPSSVKGDPLRLRQILTNLIGNAIKFTDAKGRVSVSAGSRSHRDAEKVELVIRVQDDGIGIPADKLDKVFEKFSQADTSITRKYGGSGLGLTIIKLLVDLMEGEIKVKSHEGDGTTFEVIIPLLRDEEREKVASPALNGAVKPLDGENHARILIVEDHAPNVLVVTSLLDRFGHRYELANNGREALAKLADESFDLVLMDVQMPEMGGLEATERIRVREKEMGLGRIPIIGITAHALAGDKEKCLSSGMDGYLTKPFNPEQLQSSIATLLNSMAA